MAQSFFFSFTVHSPLNLHFHVLIMLPLVSNATKARHICKYNTNDAEMMNRGETRCLHSLQGSGQGNIRADPSHPGHDLLPRLPSGKCYTAVRQNSQTQEQLLPTHTEQLISRVISETISAQYHRNTGARLYPQL